MTTIRYVWKSGGDATKVGQLVDRLAKKHDGVCPPSALVDAAREVESPAHHLFTWDDVVAAESWRRHEARRVINSIRVVVDGRPDPAPAFIHVRVLDDDTVREGYASAVSVANDDGMQRYAVAEALAALNGWRRRFEHIEALAPIFEAIDEVAKESAA